jgi:tRNA threonylcarbamoyladenosine modification (KEOPS) complex  Pcc1 subunit
MTCTAAIKLGKKYQGITYSRIMGKVRGYKRSKATTKETTKTLLITITANDAAALRATISTTMRDFNTIEAALSVKQRHNPWN